MIEYAETRLPLGRPARLLRQDDDPETIACGHCETCEAGWTLARPEVP